MTATVEISNLALGYRRRRRLLPVIKDVSFTIPPGTAYGLVGESGCGKSTVAMALMRYLPASAVVQGGSIRFFGEDVLEASPSMLRQWRGGRMAMVYQDPGSALNPSLRIGRQLSEPFLYHRSMPTSEARRAAEGMLDKVQIADARGVMARYPHELSGGQQQRVMIAMALARNPELLVLDEPTTGLDATVEAEVLDLIEQLRIEYRTAILFISHNLGIVARMCERIGVLYAGYLVEEAPARALLDEPRHPYTDALLRCYPRRGMRKDGARLHPIPGALPPLGTIVSGCPFAPRCRIGRPRCEDELPQLEHVDERHSARCFYSDEVACLEPLRVEEKLPPEPARAGETLSVSRLRKRYRAGASSFSAVDDVSFAIAPGEVFGLVGESGSGKSTLAKCIVGLIAPSSGEIRLAGEPVKALRFKRRLDLARKLQIVFQNPDTSLNPSRRVRQILANAVRLLWRPAHAEPDEARIVDLSKAVRLEPFHLRQWPKALSGGLKQRVAIARAFAGQPSLVVCDEPVSALDVSVQAAILNLFVDLQLEKGVSYLFISHDLGVVRYLADRIGVMYLGQLVEVGAAAAVFGTPMHPYTEALLSAVSEIDGREGRVKLRGSVPSPAHPPSGCRFHTRCHRFLGSICEQVEPPWQTFPSGQYYRCHIAPQDVSGANA